MFPKEVQRPNVWALALPDLRGHPRQVHRSREAVGSFLTELRMLLAELGADLDVGWRSLGSSTISKRMGMKKHGVVILLRDRYKEFQQQEQPSHHRKGPCRGLGCGGVN